MISRNHDTCSATVTYVEYCLLLEPTIHFPPKSAGLWQKNYGGKIGLTHVLPHTITHPHGLWYKTYDLRS
jgi:hypothetical protein